VRRAAAIGTRVGATAGGATAVGVTTAAATAVGVTAVGVATVRGAALLAAVACAALVAAACGERKQPAQNLLTDIATVTAGATTDANHYLPERLRRVESDLGDLEIAFDAGRFAEILARGPGVLEEAHALAADASAASSARKLELTGRWQALSAALPGEIDSIASRIDQLRAGADAAPVRAALRAVTSLWSKAQAAFATGNLEEAVSTAVRVDGDVDQLAASLNCPRLGCRR
jgi:hypothetical protein